MANTPVGLEINLFPVNYFLQEHSALYAQLVQDPLIDATASQLIPIPSEIDRNIPRMILQFVGVKCAVTFAFEKISISAGQEVTTEKLIELTCSFLRLVETSEESPLIIIKRAGLLATYLVDQNPINFTKGFLLKDAALPNLKAVNLTLSYRGEDLAYTYNGQSITMNKVLYFNTLQKQGTLFENPDVTRIQIDYNTHQSHNLRWYVDDLETFLNANKQHIAYESLTFITDQGNGNPEA